MAQLPPSPFLSAASLQPVAGTAASSPLSSLREAAVTNPVANASAEARPSTNLSGRQAGLSDGEAAIVAPVAEDVSRLADGRTSAATSEFMDATSRERPALNHIHEIFAGAAKIDDHRFILDEQALLYTIEEGAELPLFIRDGEHLRRWA